MVVHGDFGFVLGALAVVAVDGVDDLLLRGDAGQHREAGAGGHRGAGFEIQRIGHGQRDGVIVLGDGKTAKLAQEARRERFKLRRNGGRRFDGEDGDLQLLGERAQNVALGDEAEIDQDLAQLVAALALQFQRAVEVLLRDLTTLDEDLAQPHVTARNLRRLRG